VIFSSCVSRPDGDFSAAVTRRREIVRTPFLVLGAEVQIGAEVVAAGAAAVSATWRTALSAGVFALNNSSAPGKLALRVIVRLLVRLVLVQGVDTIVRRQMMMHKQ
jgi:hypothetical protein